ncbi:MAG TPA: hypothetical protein VHV26_01790 [Rhizomicrobium sp.]|jgi:hypothetical protein|nr:hypothetical protein [Rhizomicrobium sp.]
MTDVPPPKFVQTICQTAPDPSNIPSGCRFRPRCPKAFAECAMTTPDMRGHDWLWLNTRSSPIHRKRPEPQSNSSTADAASLSASGGAEIYFHEER